MKIIVTIVLLTFSTLLLSQHKDSINIFREVSDEELFKLSVEELLNVNIVSASREEENFFDSPTSSFVITRSEIASSGVTSIPEALRLCPGAIVKEISNGTYNVSLRGGIDGFPSYNFSNANTTILVMINDQPVFSYLQGGTFWQNLPVGLAEIERIEIVHGPSTPLYGPNAVSGVINIITKSPEKNGVFFRSNIQTGTKTVLASVLGGERISEKFAFEIGLDIDNRDRFDTDFYDANQLKYVPLDSVQSDILQEQKEERFPNLEKSIYKVSSKLNFYYTPKKDINLKISTARNQNTTLNQLVANLNLSNYTNLSSSIFIDSKIKASTVQASYISGVQGLTGLLENNKYKYRTLSMYLDHTFYFLHKKLSLTPVLNYQSYHIDDREFTVDQNKSGTFNGVGTIENIATALRTNINLIKNIRVVLAGRYDRFTYPSKGVFSYQAIFNYKLNDSHNFRLLTGKSFNSSFTIPTLINTNDQIVPGFAIRLNGNTNLSLTSNTLYEFGYRTKFKRGIVLDAAIFSQKFENLNDLILQEQGFNTSNGNYEFIFQTENLPLEVIQNGITIATQIPMFRTKLRFNPNITIQKTRGEYYSAYPNNKGAYDNPFNKLEGHKDSTETIYSDFTPAIFGGANLTYCPNQWISFNSSLYYLDKYTATSGKERNNETGHITPQEVSKIGEKLRLNFNVTCRLSNKLDAFFSAKNILGDQSPEEFGSDKLDRVFLLGLNFDYR